MTIHKIGTPMRSANYTITHNYNYFAELSTIFLTHHKINHFFSFSSLFHFQYQLWFLKWCFIFGQLCKLLGLLLLSLKMFNKKPRKHRTREREWYYPSFNFCEGCSEIIETVHIFSFLSYGYYKKKCYRHCTISNK